MTEAASLKRADFRPSSLDKLSECSWFASTPGGNEATSRGDAIDLAFRTHFMTNPESSEPSCLAEEDKPAVGWAVEQTRRLAGESLVITGKQLCKIDVPNFEKPGEIDALVADKYMHFDVKSGQKRSYKLQQAAYALGLMDRYFTDYWTVFLLYCDQRETQRLVFTYEGAKQLIEQARAEYDHPQKPTVNEFCSWCANFERCPTQRELAGAALTVVETAIDFDPILADPQKLGRFLDGCKAIEEFQERAKKHAKEEMLKGRVGAEGWKLVNKKGSEFVDVQEVLTHISTAAIAQSVKTLSRDKYEAACAFDGVEPRMDFIRQTGGSAYLRQTKAKSTNGKS
jgi:CRISPR/Cas system-associated exonuclease Cas4 (RecB family)